MQIGAGLYQGRTGTRVIHPVDLLDEAYATGIGAPQATTPTRAPRR